MLDQAQDLRRLANCHAPPETPCHGRPALVVVLGGKGGVGSTTVGLNLAEALAQSGKQTLLVDADPRGGDVAMLCGIEECYSLADLLEDRHPWEETIQAGPSGVKLVVGHRAWHQRGGSPAAAAKHLLERLGDPDLQADLAVIDAGNVLDGAAPHLCRMADAVLLVTTTDAASVVNTFAAIKELICNTYYSGADIPVCRENHITDGRQECLPHWPFLLVNMAPNARVAEIVHYRLARACRRLLGVDLPSAGHLGYGRRGQSHFRGFRRENWDNPHEQIKNGTVPFAARLERDCPNFRGSENGIVPFAARLEESGSVVGNDSCRPIRLNLQASSTDTMRRLLAADVLLNWRRHAEFNERFSILSTMK